VHQEVLTGQNPYTDPPPLSRRRFYEDPKPPTDASEEQVLQGRGAPAYYPPDAPPSRPWNPRLYHDQADTPRPEDSKAPEPRAAQMTVEQLVRLPQEEQEKVLQSARESGGWQPPEFHPTRDVIAEEDEREKEGERLRAERDAAEQRRREGRMQQQQEQAHRDAVHRAQAEQSNPNGTGVGRMAPAHPGTLTSGEAGEPEGEPRE
jgi:hypothetical protein